MPTATDQSNSSIRARTPFAATTKAVLITLAVVVAIPVLLGGVECARSITTAVPLDVAPLGAGERYTLLATLGDDLILGVSYSQPISEAFPKGSRETDTDIWVLSHDKVRKTGRRSGVLRSVVSWRDGLLALRARIDPLGHVTSEVTRVIPGQSEELLGVFQEDLQHIVVRQDGRWAAYGSKVAVEPWQSEAEPWRRTRIAGLETQEWIHGLAGFGKEQWLAVTNLRILLVNSHAGEIEWGMAFPGAHHVGADGAAEGVWVSLPDRSPADLIHVGPDGRPKTEDSFVRRHVKEARFRGNSSFVLLWGGPNAPYAYWIARLEHQDGWREVQRKRLPHSIVTAVPWRNGVVAAQYGRLYFIEL